MTIADTFHATYVIAGERRSGIEVEPAEAENERAGVRRYADGFNDANAFRTGAAFGITGGPKHQLSNATITLNVKSLPNVMIRPEIRFDESNIDVFHAKKSQFTLGLGATYIF